MPSGIKIERFASNSLDGGSTYASLGMAASEHSDTALHLFTEVALALEAYGKQPSAMDGILGTILRFMSLQDGLLIAQKGNSWHVLASRGHAQPIGTRITDPSVMHIVDDASGLPRIHQHSQSTPLTDSQTDGGFDVLIPLRFNHRTAGLLMLTSSNGKTLPGLEHIATLRIVGVTLAAALLASPEPTPLAAKTDAASPDKLLTARELQVLAWLPHGLTNAGIAEKLNIAPGTVKSHVERILHKLGLSDRTQAAVYAARYGLDAT
ncbi:response regulator transcription factor [Dyella acidisoli]|uniref:Helix-turn-helix transcriptional regulator n=1 Tax=Dyella acidisoli TaxID=1867834 RepID=A0ABQ5XT41_9GAMM|nr:response regulator transcription factor [Dyella acidisoli]GLQ93615.1 helix-turn-helix transcriptional regulator [Dyella acidisoli]